MCEETPACTYTKTKEVCTWFISFCQLMKNCWNFLKLFCTCEFSSRVELLPVENLQNPLCQYTTYSATGPCLWFIKLLDDWSLKKWDISTIEQSSYWTISGLSCVLENRTQPQQPGTSFSCWSPVWPCTTMGCHPILQPADVGSESERLCRNLAMNSTIKLIPQVFNWVEDKTAGRPSSICLCHLAHPFSWCYPWSKELPS